MTMERRAFLHAAAGVLAAPLAPAAGPAWRAGVAAIDITPSTSMWMAGFAARTRPSQGVALPLQAKAIALEDSRGRRALIISLDLLGVTAAMTTRVAAVAARRFGVPRARLLVAASHTHCGPVVDDMLSVAYGLTADQQATIAAYSRQLEARLIAVAGQAMDRLAPAMLWAGESTATFAANRRVQFAPDGPVDHRVPLLRVDVAGRPRAVIVGYACHNTTLQAEEVEFHGDYAGVAQAALEAAHPGLTALYVAGCGADANPKPRGTRLLVEQHGRALATAVEAGLTSMVPVGGPLNAAFAVIDLPFAPAPGHDEWQRRRQSSNVFVQRHAALMLETLAARGRLPAHQPDPVQVWRFGRDLALVALGGEVVVDYALGLARAHPGERLWVAAYANDVFGYVPSLRVLKEGGYEGGDAMLYYGRPGPFDATVEDRLMSTITRLLRSTS